MRSRASIRGHSLHPALIPFPLAFLYGAFFFDIAGVILDETSLWTTGGHLTIAGIVMGLVAAVPGIIDYASTVPPESTGKLRARKHALANTTALALFACAWWLRPDGAAAGDAAGATLSAAAGAAAIAPPGAATLILEVIGLVMITMGAWMGGTLVSRNQIGIDHRYAGAGKWREQHVGTQPGAPLVLRRPDDIATDQLMLLHIDGRRLVLGRTADGFVAFDDRCTHRGASLADGVMICGTVQCPWHGSQFDVRTGAVRAGPADETVATYRVEEAGDELHIHLS